MAVFFIQRDKKRIAKNATLIEWIRRWWRRIEQTKPCLIYKHDNGKRVKGESHSRESSRSANRDRLRQYLTILYEGWRVRRAGRRCEAREEEEKEDEEKGKCRAPKSFVKLLVKIDCFVAPEFMYTYTILFLRASNFTASMRRVIEFGGTYL